MKENLASVLKANALNMRQAAEIAGVDKSVVVKVCGQTYYEWERKEAEIIEALRNAGYNKTAASGMNVDTSVLVKTDNVARFFALADDLADPSGSLSSSIGMAVGTAERGKTHAARKYAERNAAAVYTLYVDGSSRVQLLRNICHGLAGVRPYSFGSCLSVIDEFSRQGRRLVIIDEADKCPLQILEMLRGINESCSLPMLLVGEEQLKGRVDSVPRLRSRVRKPVCLFEPLRPGDVSVYYSAACGISLDAAMAETLYRRSRGGFRTLVNEALALAKLARTSGIDTVTPAMVGKLGG